MLEAPCFCSHYRMHSPCMTIKEDNRIPMTSRGPGLLAAGVILAAPGAASCCLVPFAVFMARINGAWTGNLAALEPYQPFLAAIAVACLGYGSTSSIGSPRQCAPRVRTARAHLPMASARSPCGPSPFSSSWQLDSPSLRCRHRFCVRYCSGRHRRPTRPSFSTSKLPADRPPVIGARSRRQGRQDKPG